MKINPVPDADDWVDTTHAISCKRGVCRWLEETLGFGGTNGIP